MSDSLVESPEKSDKGIPRRTFLKLSALTIAGTIFQTGSALEIKEQDADQTQEIFIDNFLSEWEREMQADSNIQIIFDSNPLQKGIPNYEIEYIGEPKKFFMNGRDVAQVSRINLSKYFNANESYIPTDSTERVEASFNDINIAEKFATKLSSSNLFYTVQYNDGQITFQFYPNLKTSEIRTLQTQIPFEDDQIYVQEGEVVTLTKEELMNLGQINFGGIATCRTVIIHNTQSNQYTFAHIQVGNKFGNEDERAIITFAEKLLAEGGNPEDIEIIGNGNFEIHDLPDILKKRFPKVKLLPDDIKMSNNLSIKVDKSTGELVYGSFYKDSRELGTREARRIREKRREIQQRNGIILVPTKYQKQERSLFSRILRLSR